MTRNEDDPELVCSDVRGAGLRASGGGGGAGAQVDIGGLLRVGALTHSDSADGPDGFRLFEARLKVSGKIGIVFDYYFQTRYDPEDDALELHDRSRRCPCFPNWS